MLVVVTARGMTRSKLGWDDRIIFVTAVRSTTIPNGDEADHHVMSQALSVTYTTMCIVQTRWGLGLPLALRPKQNRYTAKVVSA